MSKTIIWVIVALALLSLVMFLIWLITVKQLAKKNAELKEYQEGVRDLTNKITSLNEYVNKHQNIETWRQDIGSKIKTDTKQSIADIVSANNAKLQNNKAGD